MGRVLSGPLFVWELCDRRRSYGVLTLPFGEVRDFVRPVRYDALKGKGQQREVLPAHLRKVKGAMLAGDYTPAPVAANLSRRQRETELVVAAGRFTLTLGDDEFLSQTDGGHRFAALDSIAQDLGGRRGSEADPKECARLGRWLAQALAVPVTLTLYIDGDAQEDFLNLQLGRAVDRSHLLSLKLARSDNPCLALADEVARLLNRQDGSPFANSIRFDSSGAAPVPLSTVCASGAADLGTSLVGLARVGLATGKSRATGLAWCVVAVFKALQKHGEDLLERGKVLTPLYQQGTKGSATMLVGLAVCLAHRMAALRVDVPTQEDLGRLVESAHATLDEEVAKNFSGPRKRYLVGKFARHFLADLPGDRHDGLPLALVSTLTPSSLDAPPLPKPPRPPPKKKPPPAAPAAGELSAKL